MKKVLTILLTLVMAICITSINNNKIKAENKPVNYSIWYNSMDGWQSSPSLPTSFNKGDKLSFGYDNASCSVTDPYEIVHNMTSSSDDFTFEVQHKGTTLQSIGSALTIVDNDVVQCNGGLKYQNGVWTDINGSSINPSTYGITVNGNTTTLSKSLYSNVFQLMLILSDIEIILNDDIYLVSTNNKSPLNIQSDCDVSIHGSNNNQRELVLKTGDNKNIDSASSKKLILNNIKFICENNSKDNTPVAINKLKLGSNCEIEISNKNTEVSQDTAGLIISNAPEDGNKYNYFGKQFYTDGSFLAANRYSDENGGVTKGTYQVNTGTKLSPTWVNAREIVILPKITPTPSPDKSKGEMVYDSTAHEGEGAFVLTVQQGHASTSAIAYFKNFEDSVYGHEHAWIYNGIDWNPIATGCNIETNSYKKPTNDGKYTKIILTKELLNDLPKDIYNFKVTLENEYGVKHEYYVDITVTDYVPSDPGKKDESCEKVIGPTWHWNNDKGICEDYGVVGTSTR